MFLTWQESIGHIALEYAYLYPPGIPLIVPGERITKEASDLLRIYQELGYSIEGLMVKESIEVWKNG